MLGGSARTPDASYLRAAAFLGGKSSTRTPVATQAATFMSSGDSEKLQSESYTYILYSIRCTKQYAVLYTTICATFYALLHTILYKNTTCPTAETMLTPRNAELPKLPEPGSQPECQLKYIGQNIWRLAVDSNKLEH